jgi:hypothetical protein
MISGATGTAVISTCGSYRETLTRSWDERPRLLVVMFNPSDADAMRDDQTITLVCHIAAHNGFGGIVVVNGIPIRSSDPAPAFEMLEWDKSSDWSARDALQQNLGVIQREAERAGAVLLAWGAMAFQTNASANWFDQVREEIECAVKDGTPIYCLGKTKAGCPIHPMARGKLKVRPDAPLIPWSTS